MKIAAVLMIKNEADIIEFFIRLNAKYFDSFYLLDHYSCDGTAKIIAKLQSEGFPITYRHLTERVYDQSKIITSEVRRIAADAKYRYIMPIDADEFIHAKSPEVFRHVLEENITPNQIGHIPMATYCPIKSDYFNTPSPLYCNFRMREFEPRQYFKVIVGGAFAKKCIIPMGSHSADQFWRKSKSNPLPDILIQHVPVRSQEQIIRKAILGSYALKCNKNRKIYEGFHWDSIADFIRRNNYIISESQLFEIAISYAAKKGDILPTRVLESSPRIGYSGDIVKYKEFSGIDLIKSLDHALLKST